MNTTNKEIAQNNKIIAEFMGFIITEDKVIIPKIYESEESPFSLLKWIDDFREVENLPPNSLNNLHFHSDWNWLMEVVEKIEQTTIKETYGQFNEKESNAIVSVVIENKFCQILSNGIYLNEIISENEETKIEAVYNACIEFIKWYNEQNKV